MLKKTIKQCAELDLRNYSVDALKKIRKICMCASVIIPSDASKEWYDAFANINIKMCASVIQLKTGEILKKINGVGILSDSNVDDGGYYFVNGIAIIETKEKTPIISINGLAIKRKNASFNLEKVNGATYFIIDDDADYKLYTDSVTINYDTVKYLEEGVVVIAGDSINFENDVTTEILSEKKVKFIAGDKITCDESIYGYINANSQVGDKIKKRNGKQ